MININQCCCDVPPTAEFQPAAGAECGTILEIKENHGMDIMIRL